MSDAKAQQEPSMEEILASIRRIISEDAEGGKPAAAPEAAGPAADPEPVDDDVLELTDKVNDDGSVVSLSDPGVEDFDIAPKPHFGADNGGGEAKDDIAFDQEEFSQALMSGTSSAAAASAFAQLEQEMSAPARPTASSAAPVASGGGLTVEQLVMDAVRPMLKTWLDTNLPGLVEDLVRAEIERVAQGGRRR
jgi:cell pole-organizing protein PopZ